MFHKEDARVLFCRSRLLLFHQRTVLETLVDLSIFMHMYSMII